ncbi:MULTISPECIES: hypothetical protein [Mycolicibacterium]|uniref:YbaB/EbfC DNA-binding family protein n=2 Tax=Mycolicibacterium fortuitum TaxID=1766 RepID=A0AAE4VCT3_MYCFO|nr:MULTISPECIES: hypothetical protein [Mycolicibacterium]MBU8813633.1 hypothetical protein [Mycolicibacterium goodii]MCV7137650.1 hypothetical protein [Mycolicibacterium fortuitum]MDV7193329.1 hypothetical protein [Mycolicibacterium fortuitum]MDV7205990.1 hypothetical protein [Mycolicibacterium fortuitum]MDV7227403.1 hypothetical protein [Mycolicibacterium fortuitum]
MSPSFSPHPVVVELLNLADAVTAEFDRFLDLVNQVKATCWDKTKTVAVTVGPNGELLNVWMKPGSKTLGAQTLTAYLNEALTASNEAVSTGKEGIKADHERELAALGERHLLLREQIDAGPLASPPPPSDQEQTDRW